MEQSPHPKEQLMRISARRVAVDVLKTLLFVLALLYLADYFRWSLFTEAEGATRASQLASWGRRFC
jgi:hypothetical protein